MPSYKLVYGKVLRKCINGKWHDQDNRNAMTLKNKNSTIQKLKLPCPIFSLLETKKSHKKETLHDLEKLKIPCHFLPCYRLKGSCS